MKNTVAALGQAWREYRRSFGALLAASAALEVPLIAAQTVQRVVAAHGEPASRASGFVMMLAQIFVGAVTSGAIALLAIDERAKGSWGWREAWARAVTRLRPLVTSILAVGFAFGIAFVATTLPLTMGLGVRASSRFFMPSLWTLMLLASPLMELTPFLAAVERVGGFRALGGAFRLVRAHRRRMLPILLASACLYAPAVVGMFPGVRGTFVLGAEDLLRVVIHPFVVLVALDVYWDARDLGGAGAAALAAELETTPPLRS